MAVEVSTQRNVVANPTRHLVFFPGSSSSADDSVLCYNYKTGQWTHATAYDGVGLFSVNEQTYDIGLVRFSSGSVDLQEQSTLHVAQDATLETAARDIHQGGRVVVSGVRPRVNGGTVAVRVGVQDAIDDAVTYSTGTALNSRSNMSHFRGAANTAEGRYVRAEIVITGGFETAMGADIDFAPQGRV